MLEKDRWYLNKYNVPGEKGWSLSEAETAASFSLICMRPTRRWNLYQSSSRALVLSKSTIHTNTDYQEQWSIYTELYINWTDGTSTLTLPFCSQLFSFWSTVFICSLMKSPIQCQAWHSYEGWCEAPTLSWFSAHHITVWEKMGWCMTWKRQSIAWKNEQRSRFLSKSCAPYISRPQDNAAYYSDTCTKYRGNYIPIVISSSEMVGKYK